MSNKPKVNPRNALILQLQQRHQRLFEAVAARVNPGQNAGIQVCLEATFGQDGSLNCLLGSNAVERANFARRLGEKACELATASGLEMAILEFADRSWMFDRHASVFDLPLLRRLNNQLKKVAASSVSVVQMGCLPLATDSFQFCPVVRSAVFLQNDAGKLPAHVVKWRRMFECPHSLAGDAVELRSFPVQSAGTWFTEVARLFDMRDPLTDRIWDSGDLDQQPRWRSGGRERTCERFQVLTMCTLDRLVMATGDLAPVLDGVLREAGSRARKLYASSDKPLHRDQIPHFWFEQQLRRKEYFVPPFIKVR